MHCFNEDRDDQDNFRKSQEWLNRLMPECSCSFVLCNFWNHNNQLFSSHRVPFRKHLHHYSRSFFIIITAVDCSVVLGRIEIYAE